MKKFKMLIMIVFSFVLALSFTSCNATKTKFEYWNECNALTNLKEYVGDVTNKNSKNYIPVEDRIAVFDMDGTLCGELFPEYLEYCLLQYRILDDPTFKTTDEELLTVANQIKESGKNYKTPAISGYDMIHAYAAAKAYAGMTQSEFQNYVKEFLKKNAVGFKNMTYGDCLYKPMIEVVSFLQENNFITYVVSGSDRDICRVVACDKLNIPTRQVIGMDVRLEGTAQGDTDGVNYQLKDTDKVIRTDEVVIKNLKMNKVFQIAKEIGKQPVLSFGNSSGDISMHVYTTTNNKYESRAYMLIADDTERDHADMNETNKRKAMWEEYGFNIISMKNDFKTIYGYNVEMVK